LQILLVAAVVDFIIAMSEGEGFLRWVEDAAGMALHSETMQAKLAHMHSMPATEFCLPVTALGTRLAPGDLRLF
jgi:hypothetical protein